MTFVSIAFVLLYPLALAMRLTVGRDKHGAPYVAGLLLLSLVFYGWHIPS
jgi:hypothetical protein